MKLRRLVLAACLGGLVPVCAFADEAPQSLGDTLLKLYSGAEPPTEARSFEDSDLLNVVGESGEMDEATRLARSRQAGTSAIPQISRRDLARIRDEAQAPEVRVEIPTTSAGPASGVASIVGAIEGSGMSVVEQETEPYNLLEPQQAPRKRYALSGSLGENTKLILKRRLVGISHELGKDSDFKATFGQGKTVGDQEDRRLQFEYKLRF